MDIQDLGSVGEFVAAIATILTLAYLAIQIRHSAKVTQASMELEASKMWSSYVERVSGDPRLQRINNTVANAESSELSPEDRSQYIWLMAEYFHKAESVFIQRKAGFISDETWAVWEKAMTGLLHEDITAAFWKARTSPYSVEFYELGDLLMGRDAEWGQVDTSAVGSDAK